MLQSVHSDQLLEPVVGLGIKGKDGEIPQYGEDERNILQAQAATHKKTIFGT